MVKNFNKMIKFNLINNAKDSLGHAVEHLTNPKGIKPSDLKIAIRDVAHVIELLLKERLSRIHPAFIWLDIDKYPSNEVKTIGVEKAVMRLLKLGGIVFSDDSIKTIKACRKIRNSIEHYEFELEEKEAKVIIGRMLSFIFDFSKRYLELDLEKEFRNDSSWEGLIDMYEFWEAHSATLEKQLSEQDKPICACPSCSADTFDLSKGECALCGHREEQIKCEGCGNWVWESESENFGGMHGDEESGMFEYSITLCKDCIKKEDEFQEYYADIANDYIIDEKENKK